MRYPSILFGLALLAPGILEADPPKGIPGPAAPVAVRGEGPPIVIHDGGPSPFLGEPVQEDTLLTGNRNFSNFIGFLSNPLQNIDPRAVTQV